MRSHLPSASYPRSPLLPTWTILALMTFGGCDSSDPSSSLPTTPITRQPTIPAVSVATTALELPKTPDIVPAPFSKPIRLEADNPQARQYFGTAVAISGRHALVSCHGDDTQGEDTGAAYVFERQEDGKWRRAAKLQGDDIRRHVRFGYAVALSDTIAAVGAEFANQAGAVYVFQRADDGSWAQSAKLQASDPHPSQLFGARIAISAQRMLIGAPQDNGHQKGAGAVYLFERNATGEWRQVARLVGDNTAARDQFGAAVAIDGDIIVVGSRHSERNTGSAYVFQLSEGQWRQTARLKADPTTAFGQFGNAVAVAGGTVMVGEWRNPTKASQAGAVHVFQRDDSNQWSRTALLTAEDATENDSFGYSLAMAGRRAVIGTLRVASDDRQASAYVFESSDKHDWRQVAKLGASNGSADDHFGSSVALDGASVLVGAECQGLEKTAGAAYLFEASQRE